ncbi:hypothetical protein BD410DRAFT_815222 [Rickenella mellea]|uniref:Shieldin complex subunit 2 first OB fold domain-containing protein n=1 Tax=Rickenella mellea TaxID=50990 RepID=A0A4Y7Q2Z8_9AGAM|nr:hypothetical protein BD410DRAFT_815222 [Rickenella mellea]
MSRFRVFLGAPSRSALSNDSSRFRWHTVTSSSRVKLSYHEETLAEASEYILPPATLEAASTRISQACKSVSFAGEDEVEEPDDIKWEPDNEGVSHLLIWHVTETTMISWPPTEPRSMELSENSSENLFHISTRSAGADRVSSMFETQETQDTESFARSDASSIAAFPNFYIQLHSLTSLGALPGLIRSKGRGSHKVNTVVAVLELEGPDDIIIRKGPDAGNQVALLKMVVGDESGSICKLTVWRDVAESWGGRMDDVAVVRGDVVSIENLLASQVDSAAPALTASPKLKPKLTICYRTLPTTLEDRRLRPDLRLGESDAVVRKVSTTVRWFQGLAGLR